ncbi:MAG: hypothetical protein D6688_14320 [Alphaproteobacteria bacterium]|nr:MAG: hypothetical protein D6688_14320 [Alphaproteobacteria bacterium]
MPSTPETRRADAERRFWVGGVLMDAASYRARQAAAQARVRALRLTQAWIAAQIEATQPTVSQVLGGRDRLPRRRTDILPRIEALLDRVEAGEVVPA